MHKAILLVMLAAVTTTASSSVSVFTVDEGPIFSQVLYVGNSSTVTVHLTASMQPVQVKNATMRCLWLPRAVRFPSRQADFNVTKGTEVSFLVEVGREVWIGGFKYYFTVIYYDRGEEKLWTSPEFSGAVYDYWLLKYNDMRDYVLSRLKRTKYTVTEAIGLADKAAMLLTDAERAPGTEASYEKVKKASTLLDQADETEYSFYKQREERYLSFLGLVGVVILVLSPVGIWNWRRLQREKKVNARKRTKRSR